RYLYVASSSSASGYGKAGTEHHVTAFSINPAPRYGCRRALRVDVFCRKISHCDAYSDGAFLGDDVAGCERVTRLGL
ncbi:MAG: hypothetical protein WA704_23635, partial [Pseudolabrys sp.]